MNEIKQNKAKNVFGLSETERIVGARKWENIGLACNLVVEHLPSMPKALILVLISSRWGGKKEGRKNERREEEGKKIIESYHELKAKTDHYHKIQLIQ